MSNKQARRDADEWLKTLPSPVNGQVFDLTGPGEQLPYEGLYKTMVLRQAAKILKERHGVESNL